MESFFKNKIFKGLKEVKSLFSMLKTLRVKKVMESFFDIKTLRVLRQWWSSFSVSKALSCYAAVQKIFGIAGGSALMLVITACGNFF